jgi:hypothetical protein
MKKYFLLTLLCFLFIENNSMGQNVDLKNGTVIVDSKEFLSYEKSNHSYEFTLYKLNTKDELIFIQYNDNQTPSSNKDDYYKIVFPGLNLKLETHNFESTWKPTVKWLIKNSLFNADGSLNEVKVKMFIEKYNENISNK